MAQMAEYLPSKYKTLSSNSSTAKKKRDKRHGTVAHTYNPNYLGCRDQRLGRWQFEASLSETQSIFIYLFFMRLGF
jgi:hypothetical protein